MCCDVHAGRHGRILGRRECAGRRDPNRGEWFGDSVDNDSLDWFEPQLCCDIHSDRPNRVHDIAERSCTVLDYVTDAGSATVTDSTGTALGADPTLAPGQTVTVQASGFTAGEAVTATVHSVPETLTPATASSTGTVAYSFTVPTDLAAGAHTLVLAGATSSHTVTVNFSIAAPSVLGTTTTTLLSRERVAAVHGCRYRVAGRRCGNLHVRGLRDQVRCSRAPACRNSRASRSRDTCPHRCEALTPLTQEELTPLASASGVSS